MKISGLVKSGLIDYPDKVAAVVFTQGCNFRCGFCHNPDLIPINQTGSIDEKEVLEFLEMRKGLLDGVVITGGEPLVQPDLRNFIIKLKKMGYLVKLDTNGSNPTGLKRLIDEKLLDYIAMDVKGPLSKYKEICRLQNTKVIQTSLNLIRKSKIPYEFRTTVVPYYHSMEDFQEMAKILNDVELYTIQGFRPKVTFDQDLQKERAFTRQELEQIAEIFRPYVKKVVIHDNI
jgi:pyruvate formate lyase activating enzyme